jgi:hypothetical protein
LFCNQKIILTTLELKLAQSKVQYFPKDKIKSNWESTKEKNDLKELWSRAHNGHIEAITPELMETLAEMQVLKTISWFRGANPDPTREFEWVYPYLLQECQEVVILDHTRLLGHKNISQI